MVLVVSVDDTLNVEEFLSVRSPVAIKCAVIGPLSRYCSSTGTLQLCDRPTQTIPYVKDGLLSHQWWCPISGILLTEVSDLYNWVYGEVVGFYRHVSAKQCHTCISSHQCGVQSLEFCRWKSVICTGCTARLLDFTDTFQRNNAVQFLRFEGKTATQVGSNTRKKKHFFRDGLLTASVMLDLRLWTTD